MSPSSQYRKRQLQQLSILVKRKSELEAEIYDHVVGLENSCFEFSKQLASVLEKRIDHLNGL